MAFSSEVMPEITFIGEGEPVRIRMADDLMATIYQAGRQLKARFVVAAFDQDPVTRLPVWGVYDLSKASTRQPGGDVSLPLPLRVFVAGKNDGAVMYAIARMGAR